MKNFMKHTRVPRTLKGKLEMKKGLEKQLNYWVSIGKKDYEFNFWTNELNQLNEDISSQGASYE